MSTFKLKFPYRPCQVSTHRTGNGQAKYELPSETFDDLMRAVTAACPHIKAQIRQDRQALLKNHTPTSSANPTPFQTTP
jgi:hypothetical protein